MSVMQNRLVSAGLFGLRDTIGAGQRPATTAGSLHNANFRIKHYVSIVGRCWPASAVVASDRHNKRFGLPVTRDAPEQAETECLELKPRDGRYFYGVIAASMLTGPGLNFTGANPIRARAAGCAPGGLPGLAERVRLLAPGSGPALAGTRTPGHWPDSRCSRRRGGGVIVCVQPTPVGSR